MEITDITAITAVAKWESHFSGDGPIVSYTIVLKLSEGNLPWAEIKNLSANEAKSEYNTKMANLKPFTRYSVAARVSRKGPGGLGPISGLTTFVTKCSGNALI